MKHSFVGIVAILAVRSAAQSLPIMGFPSTVGQERQSQVQPRLFEARERLLTSWRQTGEQGTNDRLRRATLALSLGSVYNELGDLPNAVTFLEEARKLWEELRIEDTRYLRTLNDLSGAFIELHRTPEAQGLLTLGLQTGRRVFGNKHEAVAGLLNTLGKLYLDQGKAVEATEALTEAAEVVRSIGAPPRTLAATLRHLAFVNLLQGRVAAARPLLEESEKVSRPLGENSLHYAVALSDLGNFLIGYDDPARAEPLLHKAKRIYEISGGPDHPDLVPVLNGLGLIATRERKFTLAGRFLEQARRIEIKNLGKESLRFVELEYSMSSVLLAEGKAAQAEAMLEHGNEVLRGIYGEFHYKVAESFRVLGMVYAFRGRRVEADAAYRRSIVIYEQTLGDHPAVAATLMEYANLLKKSDKIRARELEQRSKGIASRLPR